jgi:hypothetical protein
MAGATEEEEMSPDDVRPLITPFKDEGDVLKRVE